MNSSCGARAFLAAGVLLAAVTGVAAQNTTGNLAGRIRGPAGTPLPDVRVVARSLETALERSAGTGPGGEYTIVGLPPGEYEVTATQAGSEPSSRRASVRLGRLTRIDFEMGPGPVSVERVRVVSEPLLLDTSTSEVGTVITSEQIRSLPLRQRDYSDLAQLDPGVKATPGAVLFGLEPKLYTAFAADGTTGRSLNLSIDGAENSELDNGFYLMSLPPDAVKEFVVIQNQYKAEHGRSTGGIVNVVTRAGGNDFGGTVFGYLADEQLRAPTFNERLAGTDKAESSRSFYGASIGGPIVKDRLFYFLAAERQGEETPIALSPILTQYAGTEPAGYPIAIARPGDIKVAEVRRDLFTLRLDWNLSDRHLIWGRFALDDAELTNQLGGELTDPSNDGYSNNDVWSAAVKWQWATATGALNELILHGNDYSRSIDSFSPEPNLTLAYSDFVLGKSLRQRRPASQEKFQLRDDFTWKSGRHGLKTGVEVVRVDFEGSDGDPRDDRDPFDLLFAFNAGVTPAGSFASGDADGNIFDDGIEAIANIRLARPLFLLPMRYHQVGVYFQDDWEIGDRWTVNLGLRLDAEPGLFDDAREGSARRFYECLANPADNLECGRNPSIPNAPRFDSPMRTFPQDPVHLSPRIGFVYRPGERGADVIRGSWGLFYDRGLDSVAGAIRAVNSPSASPSFPPIAGCRPDPTRPGGSDCTRQRLTAGTVVDPRLAPLPADFTLANWTDSSTGLKDWVGDLSALLAPASFSDSVFLPSPDWKMPYVSSYALGWGHAFTPRLSLDMNLIYRRGFHQLMRHLWFGGATGHDFPFPAVPGPSGAPAAYPGRSGLFMSDGKYEYRSLQASLRGRFDRLEFGWNVNVSRASATQDSSGTGIIIADGGPFDISDGGNIATTGGDLDDEWGQLSGDQLLYSYLYAIGRLPRGFELSGTAAYGSEAAFQGFAGYDRNGDGHVLSDEYAGPRGGGRGDDLFTVNLRASKRFATGGGTHAELFVDCFNVFNRVNHGLYVIHRQYTAAGARNADYERPTGSTLTPPRTVQLGFRYSF